MAHDGIETRLAGIENRLAELCKLLVQENVVAPTESISAIARRLAEGDDSALRAHNKKRNTARRYQ